MCSKSTLYHNWHHNPHHQKVHFGTLGIVVVVAFSLILQTLIGGTSAYAAASTWSFGNSADYAFDSANLEVVSNTARLKDRQYTDDDNTQALWHLDETEGSSAADASGNNNAATLQNSAGFAAGRSNNGLSLSGANQYASVADSASLSLSSSMTLEAYVKFNSAFDSTDNVDLSVLDKGNYKLYFDSSDGKLKFELEGNEAKSWAKAGEDNNGSWPSAVPTNARVFADYNSELYAGTSGLAGSAEVWKYGGSGTAWTKVGGDELNGSWNGADFEDVDSMVVFNSKIYAGLGASANDAEIWAYDGSSWLKVGGDSLNGGWGANYDYVYSLAADATYLYAGLGATAGEAEVWRYDPVANSWGSLPIGGDGYNSSWTTNYEMVYSFSVLGSNLYAGLGSTAGDAEVWEYNGTTWAQVGGDSVQSSWTAAGNYETVESLANDGTYLYAGLGASAGDAEVWRYNPATDSWGGALIGGDGTGWANSVYDRVRSLTVVGGTLYAGLGDSANEAEVWRFNNPGWTLIGGDAVGSSWQYNKEYAWVGAFGGDLISGTGGQTEDAEVWRYHDGSWSWIGGRDWTSWGAVQQGYVTAMAVNSGKLYAAFGGYNKFATVWEYNGSSWTHVGGSNINSSWDESYEYVWTLASYKGKLYAGLGDSAGDGDVYEFNGSDDWTLIGGDAERSSWTTSYERVRVMAVFQDYLYAGLGSGSADGELWRYDGSAWEKIGGDGLNSSWVTSNEIFSLAADGQYLYVGLGMDNYYDYEAEVWRFDGSNWTIIGGDRVNSSWGKGGFGSVFASAEYNSKLYFGLGNETGMAEVWELNGSTWTMVGGNTVNSSWGANTFEGVYTLTADDNYLYAGLDATAGDAEVWRYNGLTWERIGGDGANSSWIDLTYEYIYSMTTSSSTLYAGLGVSADDAEVWAWDGEGWTKIGGDGLNSGWTDADNVYGVYSLLFSGTTLYAGTGYAAGEADVWAYADGSWAKIGGDGVNSSWAAATFETVYALAKDDTYLYAGLGASANDAEVWRYNGSWQQIGGDSLNSGWTTNYENVLSMAVSGSTLYAGLGASANDAEVWAWNGTGWQQIGGDSLNSGWTINYENVRSLLVSGGALYAGLGDSANEAEVWAWSGSSWTKKGGDGLNSSWTDYYDGVYSLALNQGYLYAGLGATTGEGEVWRFDGSGWQKIGGDGLNSGWVDNEIEYIASMASYNGELYVGTATTAGDGDLWRWNGSSWTKIGGDLVNSSWAGSTFESVPSLIAYSGKLYAGLGYSNTGTNLSDGEIWSYGDNKVLSSAVASWETEIWHHVAATYNGSTMKLYVDGSENSSLAASVALADNSLPLYLGRRLAGHTNDATLGTFTGVIDEIRISNSARSSFYAAPYQNSATTIQPATALDDTGVKSWSGFAVSETLNGGTINYRLSDNAGASWKYWNESWTASASTANANSAADINSRIADLAVTNDGILWQAVLLGNGDQQVVLSSVQITYVEDTTDPVNPDALTVTATCGSREMTADDSGGWCNDSTPSFSWSGDGDGEGSGIEGYWVYFGTSSSADPRTARGLATELNGDGVHFQTDADFDIGTDSAALSDGATYYLLVLAKDKAENYPDTAWSAFTYKYDGAAPTPPANLSASPSGYSTSRDFSFLWPSSGSSAASDSGAPTTGSDIAGYQYKTGAAEGSYSSWSSTITETLVSLSEAAYQDGANTFILRVVDNAGNNSAEVTVSYYYAGNAPSAPQNLTVTPQTSESTPAALNSFAFSWSAPETFSGSIKQYRYSINNSPTASTSIITTQTTLLASSFATRQGENTIYVVAEDEAGNINYDHFARANFYAETPAPGLPLNLVITDSSNRISLDYRLTITWSAPASGGQVQDYLVKRSLDGVTFDQVGTVTSTGYIDSDLDDETTYFYKIYARDNAGSTSADPGPNGMVGKRPTGKYTSPPAIDSSTITAATGATTAEIEWRTDRSSDSFVEYGTTADYGSSFGSREEATNHSVALSGLTPGTTYHFRVQSLDPGDLRDYNQAIGYSEDFTFTTTPAPNLSNVFFSDITTGSAILTYETNKASTSVIEYGTSTNYGLILRDNSSGGTTQHTIRLSDLQDGTTYQVKIAIHDADGNEVVSPGHAFTTIAKPRIENVRFESLPGEATTSVKVSWTTNVPTSGFVEYQADETEKKEVSASKFETSHEFIIRGLLDQSTYRFQAGSRDQFGNEVNSDVNTLDTPLDSRPPQISNLTTEVKSSGFGDSQKAQLVVTWETDELSTSQIEYSPGISGTDYAFKTREDAVLSKNHVVIVGELEPSKIYHFRTVSNDRAGNTGRSEDSTVITGKIQRSVVDIILNSLERSFGWMFGVFGNK